MFVGSNLPHKNISLLVDCAKRYPYELFVVATDKNPTEIPNNIIVIKGASFSQLKSLYNNAYCFILPSNFKGIAIPPLEAVLSGCNACYCQIFCF